MIKLPEYIGPLAFGIKMGVILPGMDIIEKVYAPLLQCYQDGLLGNGDVICITESVVARAQNNYVTIDDIAREVSEKLNLAADSRVAVVFPIASRNRFSMILRGIARAVRHGEVVVQLSYPFDEVGNQVISSDFAHQVGKEVITMDDLGSNVFKHPVTGVDYIHLYHEIIQQEGARAVIYLCNNPKRVVDYMPDGVIAADIHTRVSTKLAITAVYNNCIKLDELCSQGEAYSEWGLLGSNMSAGEKIKLAPRDGKLVVAQLQQKLKGELGIDVQVLIYGDGAYRDPTSGIYELADPQPVIAATDGLNLFRDGLKYKYLADLCFYEQGKTVEEIESILLESMQKDMPESCMEREGTTPRRMEDILASLADLVSGSADAGTPVVLIKGFLGS